MSLVSPQLLILTCSPELNVLSVVGGGAPAARRVDDVTHQTSKSPAACEAIVSL